MKKTLSLILALVMLLAITACGQTSNNTPNNTPNDSATTNTDTNVGNAGSNDAGDAAPKYKFGFTEWASSQFFDSVYDGFMSVVEEHGDAVVIHSEGKADATYQQSVIEDFIAQGCDVVFYNPVDSAASGVAVDMMREAGIIIVNFDSQVLDTSLVDAFVATDNYQAGYEAGVVMVKDFPNGGKVAVLDYPANTAAVDRENGFRAAIEGTGLEVVVTLDGQGSPEIATDQMDDILQAHPYLAAVFCTSDDMGFGSYSAITAANMETKIYSVNGSPEAKAMVAQGGIYRCTSAQSTINMGKQSAEVAYSILNGETIEDDVLIAPIPITVENIGNYNIDGWQ